MFKMKFRILLVTIFCITISCTQNNTFPVKLSEQLSTDDIVSHQNFSFSSERNYENEENHSDLKTLIDLQHQFENKNNEFDLPVFENAWKDYYLKQNISDIKSWVSITGLLLELTGKEMYAAELERLNFLGGTLGRNELNKIISPFIFTKNTDHLYVNIFTPSEINYRHTLGGDVKVEMVTDYPRSGKVNLNLSLTEKRYIELNIRIPDWAENATVTVKQVKYFAAPGSYCKIAKKWKEGDLVEIEFPVNQMPQQLLSFQTD